MMRTAIPTKPSVKYQNLMQCVWIHLEENDEIQMASACGIGTPFKL